MANTISAKRMIRVNERKRRYNKPIVSMVRALVAKTERLILSKQAEQARASVDEALSALDRAAQKGVIHVNNAARRKSRLIKRFNETFRPA